MAPGQSKNVSSTLRLGCAPSSPCQLCLPPLLPIQSLASGPRKSWLHQAQRVYWCTCWSRIPCSSGSLPVSWKALPKSSACWPPLPPGSNLQEGSFCFVFYPLYYEFLEGRLSDFFFLHHVKIILRFLKLLKALTFKEIILNI